jgi:outer membrane protein assembly factor BamB
MKNFVKIAVLTISVFLIAGCSNPNEGKLSFNEIITSDITDYISEQKLYSAGLGKLWENDLAILQDEQLKKIDITGDYIYALTNTNYLFSLNRKDGRIIFSNDLIDKELDVLGFRLYENEVFTVAGNRLLQLGAALGNVKSSILLDYTVSALPDRNEQYFYLGADDGIVRSIRVKDKIRVYEVTGEKSSPIISVFCNSYGVIFANETGSIVCAGSGTLSKRWEFIIPQGLRQKVSLDGDSVYAIAEDAKLYRIALDNGELIWKKSIGGANGCSPTVGESNVYQVIEGGQLIAVDKQSGKILWQVTNAIKAVAEIRGKTYLACKDGLKVVDTQTGELLRELDLDLFTVYGVNMSDELIYIADTEGNICCVKPLK